MEPLTLEDEILKRIRNIERNRVSNTWTKQHSYQQGKIDGLIKALELFKAHTST